MWFGVILSGAIGIVCVVLGSLIWQQEKISLLHEYYSDKVSAADKKVFCRYSGIGVILIGIGLFMTAVLLAITNSVVCFTAFAAGFAAGLALLIYAEKKYNRS